MQPYSYRLALLHTPIVTEQADKLLIINFNETPRCYQTIHACAVRQRRSIQVGMVIYKTSQSEHTAQPMRENPRGGILFFIVPSSEQRNKKKKVN
jgi:hypothetical protein